MYCRSPIPLGGRVQPNLSSGCSFSRSRSSLGRLGRGALSGIWALAPHHRCLGHGGITRLLVGRSVGNSPGHARSPVFDGTRPWAGPRPWQNPEGRGYWREGRSVYSSGEMVGFTMPRWEPGEAFIRCAWRHAPDAGCQLSSRVDHGGTHRSMLGVAEPWRPVSVSSWPRISAIT